MHGNMEIIGRVAKLKGTSRSSYSQYHNHWFFMSTRSTKINTAWLFPLKFEEPPTQNIYTDFMDSLLHSHFKERKIYNMHEEGLRNDDLNFSNAFFSPTPLLIINIRNRECPLPCIDGKLFGCFIHGLELFKYC